jgi:UDP-N-acetylmuramate--alanine ligase
MFKTIRNIHFVGIGGSGMSGIAEVLITLGYQVSGSDLKETEVTERLARLGARVRYGHHASNVGGAQVVVTSTAVDPLNPEVKFARENKIPVIPRIEMLAEIARLKYTIAVGGTHGKTTTTSMVASIFQQAGMDPTFIVGGKIHNLQSGARLGKGEFLIAEADESDGSFLKLSPTVSIITNIDNDHLDYHKTVKKLREAFVTFGNRVPFYGCAIVCTDDPGVRAVLPQLKRSLVTYGLQNEDDYSAREICYNEAGTSYQLLRRGSALGEIRLQLAGRHNVLNSLAAVACGMELGIPFEKVARALEQFESVARRLDRRGEKNGALWIDDYGHHPTEIRAVLSALKGRYPDRKISVLFQPHRYSRTKILLKDFAASFGQADELLLLPIYPAGEKPLPGVSSDRLGALVKKAGVKTVLVKPEQEAVLKQRLRPGTVFVTLGAGDVWKLGQKIFK